MTTTPNDLTTALAELAELLEQTQCALWLLAEDPARNRAGVMENSDRRIALLGQLPARLRAGRASEGESVLPNGVRAPWTDCACDDGKCGRCVNGHLNASTIATTHNLHDLVNPTPPPTGARDEDVEAVHIWRWLYRAVLVVAREELDRANRERESPRDWPAGQTWDELAPSSQGTFLRLARERLGIPHAPFLAIVRGDSPLADVAREEWDADLAALEETR